MHGGISVSLDYEWAGFNELYTCVFTVFCIVCNSIISHFLVILMNANNKGGRGGCVACKLIGYYLLP